MVRRTLERSSRAVLESNGDVGYHLCVTGGTGRTDQGKLEATHRGSNSRSWKSEKPDIVVIVEITETRRAGVILRLSLSRVFSESLVSKKCHEFVISP